MGMIVLSLGPAGIYQFAEGIEKGLWWARSPAVTGSEFIHQVTWLRLGPDLVFFFGAVSLLAFVVRAIVKDLALRRAAPQGERVDAKKAA
jgi:nitric oxide reductase subunit B